MNLSEYKKDNRPMRLGWAPGDYTNRCHTCSSGFIGDKRAWTCADCAYEDKQVIDQEEMFDD